MMLATRNRQFILGGLLALLLALSASAAWAQTATPTPAYTTNLALETNGYRCVLDPTGDCVPGMGSGNILYLMWFNVLTTQASSSYYMCRLSATSSGELLGQADIQVLPNSATYSQAVCAFYLAEEPADAVTMSLVGKPTAFVTPVEYSTSITYTDSSAKDAFTTRLVGVETISVSSIAGSIQESIVTPDTELIFTSQDGTIRFTDAGSEYFQATIPSLQLINNNLFQYSLQAPDGFNQAPDLSLQEELYSRWPSDACPSYSPGGGSDLGNSVEAGNAWLGFPACSHWFSGLMVVAMSFAVAFGVYSVGNQSSGPTSLTPGLLLGAMVWVIGGAVGWMPLVWLLIPGLGALALIGNSIYNFKGS